MRHCNWIRFVKSSSNIDDVNFVAVTIKEEPVFQAVKHVKPNDPIVVFFDAEEENRKQEPEVTDREIPEQEQSPEIGKLNNILARYNICCNNVNYGTFYSQIICHITMVFSM